MKKTITVSEFVAELIKRIDEHKSIDCCIDEIKNFALLAKNYIGEKTIDVNWKQG